jgi:D-alanyl-D-alanine endopeptidase (penicillin-binding protein 7)
VRAAFVPAKPSLGEAMGLRDTEDALSLRSSVALVMDQNTNEVLFQKNPDGRAADRVHHKADDGAGGDGRTSADGRNAHGDRGRPRYREAQQLAFRWHPADRQEMLLLALMSSENRAASALGRNYPGGLALPCWRDEPQGARAWHE